MSSNETNFRAEFILEVIGRPPEYLTETLENLLKQISEDKGIKVLNKKINSPVLMQNRKDFYTSFAEVEVETENVIYLLGLMFKYMPAHIQIISPEKILLKNSDFNEVFNELIRRLHGYEEIARILQTEKKILENKLREAVGENIDKDKIEKPKKKVKKND